MMKCLTKNKIIKYFLQNFFIYLCMFNATRANEIIVVGLNLIMKYVKNDDNEV